MTKSPQTRHSRTASTLLIVIAGVAALYLGREIFIPLAFAVTLALILSPLVNYLERRRLGRVFPALLVVALVTGVAGFTGFVIFKQLVQVAADLPRYQANILSKIQAIESPGKGTLGKAAENVEQISKELDGPESASATRRESGTSPRARRSGSGTPLPVRVVPEPVGEAGYIRNLIGPLLTPVRTCGIVLIFTVFLLIEQDDLRRRLFRLTGLHRINAVTQALADATARVSRYLILQFAVNAAFGALIGTALSLMGLPYAALWGAVAAILRTIPYIGSTVGALLPALLAVAVFDSWFYPAAVLLLFIVLELIIAYALEPWLYGRHTGISALALLVTAVFWTLLWGPAGLVLSTPLTVSLVVLGRHLPQFSFLHIVLGDEPALAPEAQLYERLLAMDDHGARMVVDAHLGESSHVHLYDSVIAPALAMVERERRKEALEADREEFIFATVREILGDLAERLEDEQGHTAQDAGRVICIPAAHESDEISATMLAQLVKMSGRTAVALPSPVRLEQLARLSPAASDLLIVSAVGPFSIANTRTLLTKLRRRFPHPKIAVGFWGYARDPKRLAERFQPAHPDEVLLSFEAALSCVDASVAPQEATTPPPAVESVA